MSAEEINDEITQRLAEKRRAAAERQAARWRQRAEMAERRDAGLERRHERKLARMDVGSSDTLISSEGAFGRQQAENAIEGARAPSPKNARLRASDVERVQKVVITSLGRLLVETRTTRGISARRLGLSVGAAASTVRRIELAQRRVSPSMLGSLARALTDDEKAAEALTARLVAAAGEQLVPDSPGGIRRRTRRERRTRRARAVEQFREHNEKAAKQRQGYALAAQAHRLLDRPGALDDMATLDQVDALLDESRRLLDEAGPVTYAGSLQPMVAYLKTALRREQPKPRTRKQRPLVEPPPNAPWSKVEKYLREKRRRELGVDYDS